MPAETITLDRNAVYDLLVEVHAVADVAEAIAGVCPTTLTESMTHKAELIAEALLGPTQENSKGFSGPRFELWQAGARRADEFLASIVRDAPPVIAALAARLEEGRDDG
jgi:hypothetical protein